MSDNPKPPRLTLQRERVIRLARSLARSGAYQDLTGILAELEHVEGFHAAKPRLESRILRDQLNRICQHARNGQPLRLSSL